MKNKKVVFGGLAFLVSTLLVIPVVATIALLLYFGELRLTQKLPETGEDFTLHYVCNVYSPDCNYWGTSGIQDAINASATGDKIVIQSGEYTGVALYIDNKTNLTIVGEGNRNTRLLGASGPVIYTQNNTSVKIRNLKVLKGGQHGIIIGGASNATLNNIASIENNFSNVATINNASLLLKNSILRSSKDRGVDITGNSTATITNNKIHSNTNSGIRIYSNNSAAITISANNIYNNTISGIELYNAENALVENNIIADNTSFGSHVSSGGNISFIGNVINNNAFDGVFLQSAVSFNFINNKVFDNNYGLRISSNVDKAVVTGNTFSVNSYSGVAFEKNTAAATILTIKGNVFKDNTLDGFEMLTSSVAVDSPTTLTISSNIFKGNRNGVNLSTQNSASNIFVKIVNNTSVNNSDKGFYIDFNNANSRGQNQFKNNIAYANISGIIFKDISVGNGYNFIYNISSSNTHNWNTGLWPPATNIAVIPQFINNYNNLHLASTSPAINTGVPLIYDPDGTRSDFGAYGGPNACLLDPNLAGCN